MTAETGNHSCICGGEFAVVPREPGDLRTLVCQQCDRRVHEVSGPRVRSAAAGGTA